MPDSNSVYMVSFPPGITVTTALGGVQCAPMNSLAYHDAGPSFIPTAPLLRYGALPDCGTVTSSRFTQIASHELIEAVTDPDVGIMPAWTDASVGEIGDMCTDESSPLPNSGIPVTKLWSNQLGACIGFNNGSTFQQVDSQHVFVMTTDQNLWFEQAPFGAANRQIVDGTTLSFQAIGVNDVFVLGVDRKLWFEHAPWGHAPPARQQVDGNVRLYQAIDSQHVLVLGTDGSLWLESGPFGTVPPSRVRVDTGVKAFRGLAPKLTTSSVFVLRNDASLWLEVPPFGTLSPTRTRVDSKVLAMVPVDSNNVYVLGTDRNLRFERGPWGPLQTRQLVDAPVRSFQALNGTDVLTLGLDGNLWREHAPFGTPPPAREQVDALVATFQLVDLDHILVLDIDGHLRRDEGPFGSSIPPAGPSIDSDVTPFGRSTE